MVLSGRRVHVPQDRVVGSCLTSAGSGITDLRVGFRFWRDAASLASPWRYASRSKIWLTGRTLRRFCECSLCRPTSKITKIIDPTNRSVELTGLVVYRIKDGKIAE